MHYIFKEIKFILFTIMRRFVKPKTVANSQKYFPEINVSDSKNHLPINKIEFGNELKLETRYV